VFHPERQEKAFTARLKAITIWRHHLEKLVWNPINVKDYWKVGERSILGMSDDSINLWQHDKRRDQPPGLVRGWWKEGKIKCRGRSGLRIWCNFLSANGKFRVKLLQNCNNTAYKLPPHLPILSPSFKNAWLDEGRLWNSFWGDRRNHPKLSDNNTM